MRGSESAATSSCGPPITQNRYIPLEYFAKMTGNSLSDFTHIQGMAENLRKGSDAFIGNAAGDDHLKVAQVGIDVEGKAVACDPAGDPHADGGYLFIANPHAREPRDARSGHSEIGNRAD